MASLILLIFGTCRRNYSSLLARAGKMGAPFTTFLGLAADFGAPVANFILWLTIAAMGLTVVSGGMWFGLFQRRFRNELAAGTRSQAELEHATERHPWSVCFAFSFVSMLVLSLFLGLQHLIDTGNSGLLATLLPEWKQMQQSLLKIETGVAAVKKTSEQIQRNTEAIADTTQKSLAKIEDLREDAKQQIREIHEATVSTRELAAALTASFQQGGLVGDPKGPADYYYNARILSQRGESDRALVAFESYFRSGVSSADPVEDVVALLAMRYGADAIGPALEHVLGTEVKPDVMRFGRLLAGLDDPLEAVTKLQEASSHHYPPLLIVALTRLTANKEQSYSLGMLSLIRTLGQELKTSYKTGALAAYYVDPLKMQQQLRTCFDQIEPLIVRALNENEEPVLAVMSRHGESAQLTFRWTKRQDALCGPACVVRLLNIPEYSESVDLLDPYELAISDPLAWRIDSSEVERKIESFDIGATTFRDFSIPKQGYVLAQVEYSDIPQTRTYEWMRISSDSGSGKEQTFIEYYQTPAKWAKALQIAKLSRPVPTTDRIAGRLLAAIAMRILRNPVKDGAIERILRDPVRSSHIAKKVLADWRPEYASKSAKVVDVIISLMRQEASAQPQIWQQRLQSGNECLAKNSAVISEDDLKTLEAHFLSEAVILPHPRQSMQQSQ